MRSLKRASGFTLVELLVVISIIGILLSMSIPAVMEARRTMARAKCAANLQQLALATTNLASSQDRMPGYLQKFGEFTGGVDPTDPGNFGGTVPRHFKVGGWPIAVMSKLDNQPAYERWSMDRYPIIADGRGDRSPTDEGYSIYAAINIDTFVCPSASNGLVRSGINHYVANTGMHAAFPLTYTRPGAIAQTVTFARSMSGSNGIFHNQYAGYDPANPTQLVATGKPFRMEDCKDGASQTLMLSENHQAQATYRTRLTNNTNHLTGITTVGGQETTVYSVTSRYLQGAVWHFEDPQLFAGAAPVDRIHKVNGGDVYNDLMTPANVADVARPSSLHTGGANMAMVDGSVKFLTESMDYRVYQAMMTPSGRSSDMPANEFIAVDAF